MKRLFRFFLKHKFLFVLFIIVVIVSVYLITVAISAPELFSIWRGEFTQEGWKKYPDHRDEIFDDMMVKIDLWSLSEEELLSILGPADGEHINSNGDGYNYYYDIIKKSSILRVSFYKTLVIKFSDNGKMAEMIFLPSS